MKKNENKNRSENQILDEVGGEKILPTKSENTTELYKSEVYHKFVEFYSLPDPDKCDFLDIPFIEKLRKYESEPTLKAFAIKFGVHQDTLTNWKKREDFLSAVGARRSDWGKDKTGNVLAALYRRCVKYGMSYDVEMYLAYFEGWDKKQVIETSKEKFDMDDIRALIAPLPKEEREKFYAIITDIITKAESARGNS